MLFSERGGGFAGGMLEHPAEIGALGNFIKAQQGVGKQSCSTNPEASGAMPSGWNSTPVFENGVV